MNRAIQRQARRLATRMVSGLKKAQFEPWQRWEHLTPGSHPGAPWVSGCYRAAKNNRYVVQFFYRGFVDHLMVQRVDGEPIRSWADMQRIKNELLGCERFAVEVFPRESRLVDDANIYHIWALPQGHSIEKETDLKSFDAAQPPPLRSDAGSLIP